MMAITKEQLVNFFEDTEEDWIDQFVEPLNTVCDFYEINTPARVAMFLAQCGHESGGLTQLEEGLNYKPERLKQIFPKYFRDVNPADYGHNPQKIANRVYGGRMGNGPESSGDGYKFRGGGLIQLTGRTNYTNFAKDMIDMQLSPEEAAEWCRTPEGACWSAGWFWDAHGLNAVADAGDIVKSTKIINGGTIGLEDRKQHYNEALEIFA